MAKTKLQGFLKGANQIVDFLKGETLTSTQYQKERKKIDAKFAALGEHPANETHTPAWNANAKKGFEANVRYVAGNQYVIFQNYTNQMMKLHTEKKKGFAKAELEQLMANNRAIKNLNLDGYEFLRYGQESSNAIMKFKQIIMDNDYRKLQYLNSLPEDALEKIEPKNINDVRLPMNEKATRRDYNELKNSIDALAKRMEELDANRHVNSSEFKKMKEAVNALRETLKENWNEEQNSLVGEKLEALQGASMDYVQAKGVGRQYTTLGKDRMTLGLDLAEISSLYMDKFASQKRLEKVETFENSLGVNITKNGVCKNFLSKDYDKDSTKANIFEDKDRGIDAYGINIKEAQVEQEIEDAYNEFDDEFLYNDF